MNTLKKTITYGMMALVLGILSVSAAPKQILAQTATPVITSVQQTVAAGSPVSLTVTATDPNGTGALNFGFVDTALFTPDQLTATFDSTGLFDWTPTMAGTFVFDIFVDDGFAVDSAGNTVTGIGTITITVTGGGTGTTPGSIAITAISNPAAVAAISGTSVGIDPATIALTIQDLTTPGYWDVNTNAWDTVNPQTVTPTIDAAGNWTFDASLIPFVSGNNYQLTIDAYDLVGAGNPVTANTSFIFGSTGGGSTGSLATINVTSATPTVAVGSTLQLTASGVDSAGTALATQPTFTWTSSNPAVGTVDANGLFTALAVGTTTVSATDGTITGSALVTVTTVLLPNTAYIDPLNPSIVVGATLQFSAVLVDEDGLPITASTTWSSSNPAVATIDPVTGFARAISAGTTNILATNGEISGTTTLTVYVPVPPSHGGGSSHGGSGFVKPSVLIDKDCPVGNLYYINGEVRCVKAGQVLGASTFKFPGNLRFGMSSDEVKELQERLRESGHFTFNKSTGYFGELTRSAVKAYQKAHGILATGFVGPLTLAELNK